MTGLEYQRRIEAEAAMRQACDWIEKDGGEPMVAVAAMRRHLTRWDARCHWDDCPHGPDCVHAEAVRASTV